MPFIFLRTFFADLFSIQKYMSPKKPSPYDIGKNKSMVPDPFGYKLLVEGKNFKESKRKGK